MTSNSCRMVARWTCLAGLVVALVSAGCAPGSGSVKGKVLFRGQPLTTGTVVFYDAANNAPSSPISSDGSFAISKVATGKARIAVVMPMPIALPGEAKAVSLRQVSPVPTKYADPEQSGLTCEVTGGNQTHDLQLD